LKMLFISVSGESLPIARLLHKEGVDTRTYVHLREYQKCYRNMLPKVGIKELQPAIDWSDMVIFDLVRANERKPEDMALLNLFGISPKSQYVFGPVSARINKPVLGMSEKTEEMELDRYKGEEIAKSCGFDIPESHEFGTLSEGVRFLNHHKGLWVFKPNMNRDLDLTFVEKFDGQLAGLMKSGFNGRIGNNISYILQKKIDGPVLSTECWFDGNKFSACNHTIEDKNFLNGDLGLPVGSMNNTVWMAKGKIARLIYRAGDFLKEAGYKGPLDMNCIITGDKIYFLEASPRIGWDAIFALLTLLKRPVKDFLVDFSVPFKRGFASTIRISVPPYPYVTRELLSAHANDVIVEHLPRNFYPLDIWLDKRDKEYKIAGTDGILGVLSAYGSTIKESARILYKNVKKIKVGAPLQYRTDAGMRAQKEYKYCKRM